MKVLIGQDQSFKSHIHSIDEQRLFVKTNNDYVNFQINGSLHGFAIKPDANNTGSDTFIIKAHNTNSTGGTETRPLNISNKIWKRIC